MTEVEIFPRRLLSADTVEELLNALQWVENIRNIILQGPSLPKKVVVPCRESLTGLEVETGHEDRRFIKVGENIFELKIKVGRVILQLIDETRLEETLKKVREVCDEILSFGYDIRTGQFTKTRPTISDSIREYISKNLNINHEVCYM